jgi:predicted nucleotidyltransferase component of viral defense system
MKDYLVQIVSQQPNDFMKRSVAREYLQARILEALQDRGVFTRWAFVGGTSLRFLFGLPRYSEDLDFSLIVPKKGEEEFSPLLRKISAVFDAEGYANDVRLKDKGAVNSALIRFKDVLFELGLSPRRDQVLSIRVEIDTNPPAGAETATTVIRKFVTLNLLHYDRPSLLAGKLHALLARPYTKGRDLFDLVWYLADPTWPEPNFILLNNALVQTGWVGPKLNAANWRRNVLARLEKIHWDRAVKDVTPFLERSQDVKLLTLENVKTLLLKTRGPHSK